VEGQNPDGELYFVFKDSLWFVSNCLCRQRVWMGSKILFGMEGSSALCLVVRMNCKCDCAQLYVTYFRTIYFSRHRGHVCLSVVSVVCCQVEVSATS